ncbi:glycoside hydrolase family 25 protein [Uliginosibacterium gangwonense]|uniref:glycoside hydrolase family 25 protein n=1 Tax=Uliginosibacterium gangwonense TaxID=392736 RepID=UPI00039EC9A1|nr:glycoside hydrolase family 25 protein [Uliginosibacterium gangwonense]
MLDNIIDLSHFNASPDFSTLKSNGVVGVIHKATQGGQWTDPTYAARKTAALNAGLYWGAYHFGDGRDVATQVKHFLSVAAGTTLLVLDVEENTSGPSMTLTQAEQFVTQVQAATGHWPGLYCGSYLKQILTNVHSTVLINCWLWYADYEKTPAPAFPPIWPIWTMWQYTDAGCPCNNAFACDRDRFNGSMPSLMKLFGAS